jgi:PKD repeat protein
MRRFTALIVLFLLVTSIAPLSPASLASPDDAAVRLQAATFVPTRGEGPSIPPGLMVSGYAAGQRGYYIVQFVGPVQQAWKDQVAGLKAELLDYIPNFAFKVRMNPAQAARVGALESVAWMGLFQPAYKLSPELKLEGTNLYRVRIERGADAGLVTAAIARSGARVLKSQGEIVLVGADADQLQAIAQVLDVAWVEDYVLPEKHNEYGAGVIMGANTANAGGYDGSTQIAAVSDTGLGDGTAAGAHTDIPTSRIVSIYDWPGSATGCFTSITNDGAVDVDSGHGTHTALSVLGDGGTNGEGKGTAPAARLVFQATENWATVSTFCQLFGGWPANGYFLTGLPDDLRTLYGQAYNSGARIHSNSWGAALAGDYTLDSANTDDFVWTNPDMAITFSAGNDGQDANNNGVVDSDSIGSPATAKNVITVGASEGERADNFPCDTGLTYTSYDAYQPGETCSSMGGTNLLGTAGQRWGFTAEPLNSDLTAGNAEQMAPFSSRGPTDDGRIKPDVVAPGTWILSGYSGLYQEGYGDPVNPRNGAYQWDGYGMPFNGAYKYMGGTSMSNPLTAGAATVVRDFYQKAHSHAASAALVKATLINSAVDLLDENNDGADDNDYPIPNVHEGWGRVNLANATDGGHQYVDETPGLGTGGSATYQFDIGSGGQPFKASLVWSDYPSTEAAATNLVNDLDLVVTAPGGAIYRGNNFSGGWSLAGGSADRVNNVENVYVQSAAAGTWTVQVSGFNVPNGPQPFALVVDGAFGAVDNPPAVTMTNPPEGATVSGTVNVEAGASDDNGITQVQFFVDGGRFGTDTDGADGWSMPWDTTTVADGSHTVTATATDTIGQTGSDSHTVTVDNVNDPPVASFGYDCTGLSCDFDASGSYDPDGTITGYDWDFGDGSTGSGLTYSHTYAAADTYTVILTVVDGGGATDTESQDVAVSDTPTTMHVGDLDGTKTSARNTWTAQVTVSVHDANHSVVQGAVVTGAWSEGATGTGQCTTGASGTCTVSQQGISKKTASVVFTVNNVTHSALTYQNADNHDLDGDSDGTTITVPPLSNQPPVASFTYSCPGLACSFDSSGSSDADGSVVSYGWDFGDGNTGSGVTTSHTYAMAGSYPVVLTVVDDDGATGTDSQAVPVGVTPAFMHVGDLDGSSSVEPRGRWNATVLVVVHDASDKPVANATVSGTWSGGTSGGGGCTTDSTGLCSVLKTNLKSNVGSVIFTVDSVAHTSYTYDPGDNHDPDGDSDGTTITVPAP